MQIPKKSVVDTNVLIDTPEILLTPNKEFVIPYTVLSELDGLKKNKDLSFAVRRAIKIIYQQLKEGVVEISNIPTDYQTNDERIVKAAKTKKLPLITQDIGARAIAFARSVKVIEDENKSKVEGYTGFQQIEGNVTYEKSYVPLKELPTEEAKHVFSLEALRPNEYIIVKRVGGKEDIWKEENGKVIRISQSKKIIEASGIKIYPLDSVQMVAWNACMSDVPLTVLEGRVGSSKTLSAIVGLLIRTSTTDRRYKKYSKIYYTRAPIPVDNSLKMGYLPGSIAEKSEQWSAGIISNLRFLFGEEDWQIIFEKYFEFVSLESIQGLSLKADEALLVDEYQLLSKEMLKQVLSRVGEGGKVILAGDPAQAYGANRSNEGFRVIHDYVGTTEFISYVELDSIYRSKFVEFVDNMFEGV